MIHPLPQELLELIRGGENITVEFKKSRTEVTKDVYETVCAFSNRDGGHIFLGVKDNGEILGIEEEKVDKVKKEFVTSVNNENKIYPPPRSTSRQLNMSWMESTSFISECRFHRTSAAATVESTTETTNLI